jgi:hypothetical protein
MHPDTIPKELFGFMVKTARVPAEALAFNRARVRGFPVDLSQVTDMVKKYKGTSQSLATVAAMSQADIIPCAVLHPGFDSCRTTNLQLFYKVTKTIFPVYATLNFVPLLVLRLKRLMKE